MDLPKDYLKKGYRMPTIRYHDTSFIIFRKWLKAQDELAFPTVHQYASVPSNGTTENLESSSHQIQRNIGFDDHYLTDSECTYTNGKVCDGRNNDTIEPERKFPRRRAKSLEKCKQPTNKSDNDNDDEIDDSDDSISLIIQEPILNDKKIQIEKSNEDDQNNNALGHENIKLQIVESINKNSIEDADTNANVKNFDESKVKDENERHEQQEENHQQQQQKDQVQCEKKDDDEEEEEEENTSIIADETKEKLSQDVIVDVHHSNKSNSNSIHSSYEALVITEHEPESQIAKDSSKIIIPDDVPDVQRRIKSCQSTEIEVDNSFTEKQNLRISDSSSDKTLISDETSNHPITTSTTTPTTAAAATVTSTTIPVPLIETKFKAHSEPFQRKKYNRNGCSSPISITSSSSLSLHTDDPDEGTDYATVDLRRPGYIYPISEDQLFAKSSDDTKPEPLPKSQSFPIPSKHHQYHHQQQQQQQQHQHHNQHNQISDTLRLHYVTQRILASVLPRRDPNDPSSGASIIINRPHSEGNVVTRHGIEDKYEKEVISMLEQKHGKNYKVLDLESCISVVTLERLCELCKLIDQWLGSGQEKVIVLQDREDRQRLGTAIAAYLEYLDICASNFSTRRNGLSSINEDLRAQNTIKRNWLDLDIFSMKKFIEDFIGPLRIPSYRRYLQLFSGLLSGKIKMNSSPIRLEFISIESPPSWLQYDRFTSSTSSSSQTEWNSFIKIYEGLQCIYTSDIHIIPITTRRFLYQIGNLRLRGDILIRCYQISSNESNYNKETMTRELLFSVQFHTCAISTKEVTFAKNELDYACDDPRFPADNKITLHLSSLAANDSNYVFQSPLIRTEPANALAKVDSVENFDIGSSYHTQGPIDGSLYATILKSPKSHPNHLPLNRSQSVQESFGQPQNNVISPPPQFSNKQYEIIDRRSINCNTPSSIRGDCLDSNNGGRLRETSTTSTVSSAITGTDRDILRGQSQSRSDYSYVESRPGTSQSTYQDKYNLTTTTTTTTNKYPSGINQQSQQHQQNPSITIVETYATIDGGNSQVYQNGRQSVRSPLTLSMDSGISSSGVLNRPPQGSSVSPSSFPSQASPQEDRHRELDDILSDMLMTVQDIPDLNKSYKQHTILVRSQSVIPTTSGNYGLPSSSSSVSSSHHHHQQQFGKDTVKRSQSYTTQQNSNLIPITTATSVPVTSAINSSYLIKDHGVSIDLYDTSSTTTTLTPPPSESGRDTPTTGGSGVGGGGYQSCTGSSSNISTLQRRQTLQRETRDIHNTTNIVGGAIIVGDKQHQQRDNIIMDLQQQQNRHNHQSSVYPQTVQTIQKNTKAIKKSEDDTTIPYHARENSQPFTYGNVTSSSIIIPNGQVSSEQDPRMIKTQSGLSSPSLVRKTLGSSSQTLRKTPPRNDFEEMLRERREKVMSEKYSISDKPSSIDFDKNFDRPWANNSATLRQTNGYHYYNNEPLKRSNTLDGFHRSTSTDGISGQTWLQLQQQKLRAKKDQEMRENRRYFEEQIHTEIRNRPLRSRANMQRYDGYASDTAAFADEVDYRRPLHVQTPYRSPDRNYHTMTTTTTTVTQKEKPFATMRRANDLTKRDAYGVREESFSSYRSETDPELSIAGSPRPETPAFPVTPRTPYGLSTNGSVSPALPPKSPTSQRRFNSAWSLRSLKSSTSTYDVSKDLYTGTYKGHQHHEAINQNENVSCYTSRRNSNSSNTNSEPQEVAAHHVKFVQDSSKYWYKPNLSREEAVNLLRNAVPGTFIVRDSTTFRNAFGLVVRVAHPPPGIVAKGNSDELVRHFLVEPTSRGVRLKGCANEPVFTSLSALVYQHSITPLALPCRLIIPDRDIQTNYQSPAQKQLLTQGAACNVLYLFVCDTESLTGEEAVRRAVYQLFSLKPLPTPTEVHFKVSQQGITLTDNTRQKFFRKHYSPNIVSFCGLDPDRHMWSVKSTDGDIPVDKKTIFAFVARRSASSADNQCHVFCDLQSNQPATAIVSFVNKVLPTEKILSQHI